MTSEDHIIRNILDKNARLKTELKDKTKIIRELKKENSELKVQLSELICGGVVYQI